MIKHILVIYQKWRIYERTHWNCKTPFKYRIDKFLKYICHIIPIYVLFLYVSVLNK